MSRYKSMDDCYLQGIFYLVPKVYNFVHEALEFEKLSFEATVKRLQIIDHLEALEYYTGLRDLLKSEMGKENKKTISCGQQTDDVYFEFHPYLTEQFILLPKSEKTDMARRMSYSNILVETLSKIQDLSDTCHLHENVTKSDIVCYDHSGWLNDLSNGKPMWCVVTDMLLCIFENDSVEKSSKVLVLPAFTIKPLVFHSAAKDNFMTTDVIARAKDSSKTVSGMERFQIVIENDITAEKMVFGTNTKSNLDRWVAVLRVASSLDLDVLNDGSDEDGAETTSKEETGDILSRYTPSLAQDIKRSDTTLSWLNGQLKSDASAGDGDKSPAIVHKIGSLSSLSKTMPNNKWCSSRKSLSPVRPETHVVPVVRRSGKSTGALEKSKTRLPTRPMSAMYSYELHPSAEDNSPPNGRHKGIGVKIARRASLIKEIFKSKPPKSPTEQDSGRISNLQDVKISGYLNQKTLLSWSKYWCAVSKGVFYVFKNKTSTEAADTTAVLNNYTLVLAPNDKNKKVNAFKLTRQGGKSIQLAALDSFDFNSWIQVLRNETMKSDDSTVSTPELSHLSVSERRSSSTSNPVSVHDPSPENRRGSVHSLESSHSNAPVLDYPESSDDQSSIASISHDKENFRTDTPPKHDVALRQLWKTNNQTQVGTPRRRTTTSIGFDVSGVNGENVLFVPDDKPETESEEDFEGDISAEDVFSQVPDISVSSVSCPSVPNTQQERLKRVSISRSCGDLPALCQSESKTESSESQIHRLDLEVGSSTVQKSGTGSASLKEGDSSFNQKDTVQMTREKQIQDMKRQRADLEKRHIPKDKTSSIFPKTAEIANKYHRAQIEEQQRLVRDATQLRQRRMSTQLKVDTLEKKLQSQDLSNNNNRKSVFGFGGKQKSTLKNGDHKHLQDQLTELKEKLTDIDRGLEEHEKHRQQTMKHLQTSETQAIQRLENHEKLKASLGAIMEVVESPKLSRKPVVDNTSISSSTPNDSPENSRRGSSKHECTSSESYRRSSNESAGSASLKSGRSSDTGDNKINPSTIAQIEEFEMLAQQVLQQKGAW